MPTSLEGGGRGSGFALGPAQNEFADAAARDAYAAANADWLALYNGNTSNWIRIGGVTIQRRNVAGTAWENVVGIISGPRGASGATPDLTALTGRVTALEGVNPYNDASVAGTTLTLTKNDGTIETFTLPSSGGGSTQESQDDFTGVAITGSTITLTRRNGQTVAISVPSGGLTQAQVDARIAQWARAGDTTDIPEGKIADEIARDTEITSAVNTHNTDPTAHGGSTPTEHDLTYGLADSAGTPSSDDPASTLDIPEGGVIDVTFPAITATGTRWYFSIPTGVTLRGVYDIGVGRQEVTTDWTLISGRYVNVAGAPTGAQGHYSIEVTIA